MDSVFGQDLFQEEWSLARAVQRCTVERDGHTVRLRSDGQNSAYSLAQHTKHLDDSGCFVCWALVKIGRDPSDL